MRAGWSSKNNQLRAAELCCQITGCKPQVAGRDYLFRDLENGLHDQQYLLRDRDHGFDEEDTLPDSSDFQPAVRTRTRTPLATPSLLNISRGNCGELQLRITPIAHARCYEVRAAALGNDNAREPWQTAGLFTSSRSLTISSLTPGTTYSFQVPDTRRYVCFGHAFLDDLSGPAVSYSRTGAFK